MKQNISSPRKGMNSDAHLSQLTGNDYPYMLNGNFSDEVSESIVQTEHSNILCNRFPEDTYVMQAQPDYANGRVYYFLANPVTGCSEIGFIRSNQEVTNVEDIQLDCGCDIVTQLGTPLHLQEQLPTCTYETLVTDCDCKESLEGEKCLNFNIKYPISSHIETTKLGTSIHFTDDLSGRRKIDVDDLSKYFVKTIPCEECECGTEEVEVCLNCEELLVQKPYKALKIKYEGLVIGGQVRHGHYVFYGAYTDKLGNELSRYMAVTDDIYVKDPNRVIYIQPELDARTNYAIKLKMSGLDTAFEYYKLVVVQRTSIDGTASYFEVGNYNIGDKEVLYVGEDEKLRTTAEKIAVDYPIYTKAKTVEKANNMLFYSDLETQKEINIQPVVNLMGQFIKWRTVMAEEDIFADSKLTAEYKSQMRDEVVPFSLRLYGGGYVSPLFPFIAREATAEDKYFEGEEVVGGHNSTTNLPALITSIKEEDTILSGWKKDVQSILSNGQKCSTEERIYKWQYYNTATVDTDYLNCGEVVESVETDKPYVKTCDVTGLSIEPIGTITLAGFADGEAFTNIFDYIKDHQEYISETPALSNIYIEGLIGDLDCCDNPETLFLSNPEYTTQPDELGYDPIEATLCNSVNYESSYIDLVGIAEGVTTPTITTTFQEEADYDENGAPSQCNIFRVDPNGDFLNANSFDGDAVDTASTEEWSYWRYVGLPNLGSAASPKKKYWVFDRDSSSNGGLNCQSASILNIDSPYQLSSYISPVYADIQVGTDLQSTTVSTAQTSSGGRIKTSWCGAPGPTEVSYSASYTTFVHKNAKWFTLANIESDEVVLNISEMTPKPTGTKNKDCLWYSNNIRLTIYDGCSNSASIVATKMVTLEDGDVFRINTPASKELYIAIDTPIVTPSQVYANGQSDSGDVTIGMFPYLAPTAGCFSINAYSPNIVKVEYTSTEKLQLRKTCEYSAQCPTRVYEEIKCTPVNWQQGTFSYWESTDKYPDNKFLYDSSTLRIPQSYLNGLTWKNEFESVFAETVDADGNYVLKESTDYRCKPIRHFKFPDNLISPITDGNISSGGQNPAFQSNKVFPLGIHIGNEVINTFLDVAVYNDLITKEFRDSIEGYEIFKGDTRLSRTVIGKGLIYDMYNYEEEGKTMHFSNFPFNTLEDNTLLYRNEGRKAGEYIEHPFGSLGNNKFTFHSPEFHFNKPTIPFEMSVSGLYLGASRGRFSEVKGHPEMVIMGPTAYNWANALAAIETTLSVLTDITDRIMSAAQSSFAGMGSFNWGQAVAWVGFGIYTAQRVVNATFVEGNANYYKWLKVFDENGTPYNFAAQYSSVGYYNSLDTTIPQGDKLRGLQKSAYIKSGRYAWNEKEEQVNINNYNRESSTYLSLGEYQLAHKASYKRHDNSRTTQSSSGSCTSSNKLSAEISRELYAQYITLKSYIPNQHGEISSVKWMSTGYQKNLKENNSCSTIFGGDTFLTRFALKRKFPFFINPMLVGNNSVGDLVPFSYTDQRNVAYPRYYVDYKTDMSRDFGRFEMPDIRSYYELDCYTSPKMYVKPPSKFYLNYYGIPSFIVESRYNLNHRYAVNEQAGNFYPNASDYIDWTQESVTPISRDNEFHYNQIYSADNTLYSFKTLPDTYNPESWDKLMDHHDRVIYSIQDNSEQDLQDNLTVFLANNYHDFGSEYGKYFGMKSLEQGRVLFRFENGFKIHNAHSTIKGTPDDIEIGNGGLFGTSPSSFHKTPIGFAGTQHQAFVSCQYGHYWVDALRGAVHGVNPGGEALETISDFGMKRWFKENLPFNIKKQFPNISHSLLDNAYIGIGITMTWDSKYSRLFITKKDVRLKKQYLSLVTLVDDGFYIQEEGDKVKEILPSETKYFEDISWTVAYNPMYKSWMSFYDFKPNYYVAHQHYFQSGNNYGTGKGVFSHLLTNKSLLTFYGEAFKFKFEVPLTNSPQQKWYESLTLKMDTFRYTNEYDKRQVTTNFDELTLYNNLESTGTVKIKKAAKNNLFQFLPKNNLGGTNYQEVVSVFEEGKHSINGFWNNVKDVTSIPPLWLNTSNNADKVVNSQAFKYDSNFKRVFRGDTGVARLTFSDTQLKLQFEYLLNKEN